MSWLGLRPSGRTWRAPDADLYKKASKALPNYWLLQLRKTIHTKSRIHLRGQLPHPIVMAANSSRLNRTIGKNWLAVGDAAITFDPLSAQGVHKALDSGLRAAHSLEGHLSGDDFALQGYARDVDHRFCSYWQARPWCNSRRPWTPCTARWAGRRFRPSGS